MWRLKIKPRKVWRGELKCWSCGEVHDAASEMFEAEVLPSPDDVTMCIECGEWSVFTGPRRCLTIRKPTADEFLEIGTSYECQVARLAWTEMQRELAAKRGAPH